MGVAILCSIGKGEIGPGDNRAGPWGDAHPTGAIVVVLYNMLRAVSEFWEETPPMGPENEGSCQDPRSLRVHPMACGCCARSCELRAHWTAGKAV